MFWLAKVEIYLDKIYLTIPSSFYVEALLKKY